MTAQPTNFGKFRTVSKHSEGASSYIYIVEKDGERYAAKHLKNSDDESVVRFRREASVLGRFKHSNFIKIFSFGVEESKAYFIMELLNGSPLDKVLLDKKGGLGESESLKILKFVAEDLSCLHASNLIHRDIKTANIYMTDDSKVKLIDCGLVDDVSAIEKESGLVGTPLYCAPEQSRVLKRRVDCRSDLYSLGVVFYECLTGYLPFVGNLTEVLHQHSSVEAKDVREFGQIRASLALIVKKLLAKDPDDRYLTAKSLLADLDRLDEIDRDIEQGKDPKLGHLFRVNETNRVEYVPRDEQLMLNHHYNNIQYTNKASVIIIEGSNGSGKTRFAEEFIRSKQSDDVLVLKSKCQPNNSETPMSVFRDGIESLIESLELLPEEVREKYKSRIRSAAAGSEIELSAFSKQLSKLFGVTNLVSNESVDEESKRENYFSKIKSFYIKLCEEWKSVIIFIDDLQWADPSSYQFIQRTTSEEAKINLMYLSTVRQGDEYKDKIESINETLQGLNVVRIEMISMNKAQVSQLVCRALGAKALDEKIVEAIHLNSTGIPSLVLEIIRSAIDQGILKIIGGDWSLQYDLLKNVAVNTDAIQPILQKIEKSTAMAKKFVQAAAIYGNTFNVNEILEVIGGDPKEVLPELYNLSIFDPVNENQWSFLSLRVVEAIVSVSTKESVKELSQRMAEHFDGKLYDADLMTLARLYRDGESEKNPEASQSANIQAGDYALKNFAYAEAYDCLKYAYNLVEKHKVGNEKFGRIAYMLARCANFKGYWDEAVKLSSLAIEESRSRDELVDSLILKTWISRNKGDYVLAFEYFKNTYDILCGEYPKYLNWKLLRTVALGASCMVLDWLTMLIPGLFKIFSKSADESKIINLMIEGDESLEFYDKPLDRSFVALRLLFLGLVRNNSRARSLGYASLGRTLGASVLSIDLAKYFCDKAIALSEKTGDSFIYARCKRARILALENSNQIDVLAEYKKDKSLYNKFLTPDGRYRLANAALRDISFVGKTKFSLKLIDDTIKDLNQKGSGAQSGHMSMATKNHLWLHLFLSGKFSQAQQLKSLSLKAMNEYRWAPHIGNAMLRFETHLRRFSGEVDNFSEEIIRSRDFKRVVNTNLNALGVGISLGYLQLRKIESLLEEKRYEETFSLRRDFIQNMLTIDRNLYQPTYKASLFHLVGKYFLLTGYKKIADSYYKMSEDFAIRSDAVSALYEINVDRARYYRNNSNKLAQNLALSTALDVASEAGWADVPKRLESEFGVETVSMLNSRHAPEATSMASTQMRSTQMHSGQNAAAQQMTQMHRASLSNNDVAKTSQSKIGSGGIEDVRFVDALLNVSSAFVSTIDTTEQAKLVLYQIVKLFAAQRGLVFIKSDDADSLNMIASKNANGEDLKEVGGYSKTVINMVLKSGDPVIVVGNDEAKALGSESAALNNLRSIMATPLKVKEKVVGVVYLDSALVKGLFSKGDLPLFSVLSNHISVSYEISRMARVEIEKANLQAELEVQQVVATESKKVKNLVDNMKQALFSVGSVGEILEPISKYSNSVFGQELQGKNLLDLLYASVPLEKKDAVKSALVSVYGSDELQWELMEDAFLKKVSFFNPVTSQNHMLKVNPAPLWGDQGTLEKILFVIEDITQLESLENQSKEQKRQALLLEDILLAGMAISDIVTKLNEVLKGIKAKIKSDDQNYLDGLLRELHTFKGNARMLKVRLLADVIHNVESAIIDARTAFGNSDKEKFNNVIESELDLILQTNKEYEQIYTRIQSVVSTSNAVTDDPKFMLELESFIDNAIQNPNRDNVVKIRKFIDKIHQISVMEIVSQFESMVDDLSKQLNKKVRMVIDGNCYIDKKFKDVIQNSLVHLIRNSVDHGFEFPENRLQASKPEIGTINVKILEENGDFLIKLKDDGKGVDGEIVAKKAIEKGLLDVKQASNLSAQEKAELIFAPGFSTKDQATDISGRGVGLDAVKFEIQSAGGTVSLNSKVGEGSEFVIRIPMSKLALAA